ncbi:ATP-binding protein [Streptomyces milbemycinicus]|uniref:ATP-binding protein n=1 Tax=Streptomyces milbemycinicus TaxID=476552 RepID=A0ABW8LGS9_9ACTN
MPVPDPASASAIASWRFALPHTPVAVPLARALVRNTLADTGTPVDRHAAELLTAELVANAVQHTDGDEPIELVMGLAPTGEWQVEVHDRDPSPPAALRDPAAHSGAVAQNGPVAQSEPGAQDGPGTPSAPDPREVPERGRGLQLLRTLSAEAGYRPTPEGKAVWFTLPAGAR